MVMVVTNPRTAPLRRDVFTAAPNVLKEGDAVCFVNECALLRLSSFLSSGPLFFPLLVLPGITS